MWTISMSEIKTLEIDRSAWSCRSNNAKRNVGSFLKDTEGFKCCLGFLGEACDIPDLLHASTPGSSRMVATSKLWPEAFRPVDLQNSDLAIEAICVNDGEIDNAVRETKIKEIFAKGGIEVTFTGEYLP
jgi:hypothetical protein